MAEHAATLVDHLLPQVPVRQWMLTLPYCLRYRLAWDHALCRAVLGVFARTLLAFYARTARARGIPAGQTGTVTVIQRFGSGLQLNVHFHTLVLDGVFNQPRPGPLVFHPAPPPSDDDVAHVLATARARDRRFSPATTSSRTTTARPPTRSLRRRPSWACSTTATTPSAARRPSPTAASPSARSRSSAVGTGW